MALSHLRRGGKGRVEEAALAGYALYKKQSEPSRLAGKTKKQKNRSARKKRSTLDWALVWLTINQFIQVIMLTCTITAPHWAALYSVHSQHLHHWLTSHSDTKQQFSRPLLMFLTRIFTLVLLPSILWDRTFSSDREELTELFCVFGLAQNRLRHVSFAGFFACYH